MATAGSLLANVRLLYGDTDADYVTDTRGLEWLDEAQTRFCHKVMPLDDYKDYPLTAKQVRYDLPADCILPIGVTWFKTRTIKMEYTPPDVWLRMEESYPNMGTGTPENYSVIRRQIVVGPQSPASDSATSTASGAMTTSNTTLGLTAASGTFRSKGFVKVDSEVIEYTGVATTTLTGCTRAVHNTTAATHASGATVTEIDLQMLYRRSPAALTATTATPEVPTHFQKYLEKYVLYLAWLSRGDSEKAQAAYNEFLQLEDDTKTTVGRRSMDGLMKIQSKIRRNW